MHSLRARTIALLVGIQIAGIAPLVAQAPSDSTVVSGTIIGSDGRLPVRADVELAPLRTPGVVRRVRAAADGSFRVALPGGGPFRLRAAGVGYTAFQRALPTKEPTQLRIAITLAGLPSGLAKGPLVGVTGETDAEKPREDMPPAVLLAPSASGRRTGTLRARKDTVGYRVVDITARTFLPPAGAAAYRWAEDYEYDGLIPATIGQPVTLVYDSSLVTIGGMSGLRVLDGHPTTSAVAELDSLFAMPVRKRCLPGTKVVPVEASESVLRDSSVASQLQLIRRFLRADAECRTSVAIGMAVVNLFSPGSPLWALDDVMQRRVLQLAARHATGTPLYNSPASTALAKARFDRSIAAAPDTSARFDLYVMASETFMPTDTITAQSYTARFVAESYAHPRVLPLLRLTGYNRVLQPGRRIPAFRVVSMDDPLRFISDSSLRGGVYLLDIWASWCGDCIREFPAMRELHVKYGKRGLRIVSVSVDEQQQVADDFRKQREQMPWTHGWAGVSPEGEGPIAKLEAAWLPTTVLVARDGRILAFAPDLESAEFHAMIERALR